MQSLEEELDVTTQKIANLENQLFRTHELLLQTIDSLKETQRFLMKLAYNQSEITKRISLWPYIAVPEDKSEDRGE
jgi:hypothetical protein